MLNRKKYKPTRAISFKGKFLVGTIRMLYAIRRFVGAKDHDEALEGHHEDPRKMNLKQQLFFGHKYYFRAITHRKNECLRNYFRKEAIDKNDFSSTANGETITINVGGDLMPYACINKNACDKLWDKIGTDFFSADLVCANLETPVYQKKNANPVPEVMLKNMYFNANEEMFSVFSGNDKYKGYDVLSVANNHSLDQGEEGLLATLNFLRSKNIAFAGAAEKKEALHDFPIIEKKGIKIAFLAYTYSLNALQRPAGKEYLVNHLNLNEENPNLELIIEQSKLARERGADFILASLHMGCAYQPFPSDQIIKNFRLISEKTGIDILLGGHPHNAMPLASHSIKDPFTGKEKKALFVFSQGDFVAYDIFKWCKLPLLLHFSITKNESGTFISNLKAKLIYTFATLRNNEISSLQFLNFKELKNNLVLLDQDPEAKKEVEELIQFADEFLLPGNLEQFM